MNNDTTLALLPHLTALQAAGVHVEIRSASEHMTPPGAVLPWKVSLYITRTNDDGEDQGDLVGRGEAETLDRALASALDKLRADVGACLASVRREADTRSNQIAALDHAMAVLSGAK
jgi:hypothetical protein